MYTNHCSALLKGSSRWFIGALRLTWAFPLPPLQECLTSYLCNLTQCHHPHLGPCSAAQVTLCPPRTPSPAEPLRTTPLLLPGKQRSDFPCAKVKDRTDLFSPCPQGYKVQLHRTASLPRAAQSTEIKVLAHKRGNPGFPAFILNPPLSCSIRTAGQEEQARRSLTFTVPPFKGIVLSL